jgi:dephospho-CoA kinase
VIVDADALAREATADPQVLQRIAREIDAALIGPNGLDRAATARRIFADPAARRALEAIVHPWVRAAAARLEAAAIAAAGEVPLLIVHDVPLLFEGGLEAGMDATIVVTAPFELRAARAQARSGLTADAVRARDAAQWDEARKVTHATFRIDNVGDAASLALAVAALWPQLIALARRR